MSIVQLIGLKKSSIHSKPLTGPVFEFWIFLLIPIWAIFNFYCVLRPPLNEFFSQWGRSRIWMNLDYPTLLALYLCSYPFLTLLFKKVNLTFSPQYYRFKERDFLGLWCNVLGCAPLLKALNSSYFSMAFLNFILLLIV